MARRVATHCLCLLLLGCLPALAQERGQYLPGFQGLNSGIQAPKGFTYVNTLLWYPSDTFQDARGKSGPVEFDLDLVADANIFAYTTGARVLGAQYGLMLFVPIVSAAVSLPRLDLGTSPWGMGDLYVEPINLGWHFQRADVKATYGFVAPTGKFDENGSDTTTTDYWGHQITFNVTSYLTASKLTQLSVATNWEFHQTKRHEDVKVGNNATIEYAVGKTFVHDQGKQLFQLGLTGYAEFQFTDDSGDAARIVGRRGKDRVFALGPEVGLILPQSKLHFLARVLPEFGARSRTSGLTFIAAAGKSF